MYEGIPTGKPKEDTESWAPKHKAVFGEESRMIHEAVFGEKGKEAPKSDAELVDAARRVNGVDPAPIHESVFGKEERVEAPIHESIFGSNEKPDYDREDFLEFRDMLAHGTLARAWLQKQWSEGTLTLASFAETLRQTLVEYDTTYKILAEYFAANDNGVLTNMESLRSVLKDPIKLKENFDAYVAALERGRKEAA